MRTGISTCLSNTRKPDPTDILIEINVAIADPRRLRSTCCRHCGFAIPGHGGPTSQNPPCDKSREKIPSRLKRRMPSSGISCCIATEIHGCCSPKTTPTTSGSSARPIATPYVKDGINNFVVAGRQEAVNPNQTGTKAAAHYQLNVGAGETAVIRLRLSNAASPGPLRQPIRSNHRASAGARPTRSIRR